MAKWWFYSDLQSINGDLQSISQSQQLFPQMVVFVWRFSSHGIPIRLKSPAKSQVFEGIIQVFEGPADDKITLP